MNAPVVKQDGISYKSVAIAQRGGGGMLLPTNFGEVVAFSEIMARSQHAIPRHLRDVPGACLAVTMQALRWELDPFLVASKSYNVKDIIAYEAQLIAAVVHTRAPLKTRPNYAYSGEGQDLRCTVSATFDDGVERSYESPRIGDITTKNSPLWKADPAQQLGYYSIRAFARRYCPEVILGVYTPEEAETFRGPDNARDVTPRPSLADRLAAAPQAAADGFSQQHVIAEIDGAEVPPINSGSSQPVSSPVDAETDKPASEPPPLTASDAGTNSETSDTSTDDSEQAGAEQHKPGAGLPEGWQGIYVKAMNAASDRPKSLPTRHTEALKTIGGEPSEADLEEMRAIYALRQRNLKGEISAEDYKAMLREIVGDVAP